MRARPVVFAALSLACATGAGLAARSAASGSAVAPGPLVPVLVAREGIPAGTKIGPRRAARDLAVLRMPADYAPPDALQEPEEVVGLVPAGPLAPGSPVLASALVPQEPEGGEDRMPEGRGLRRIDVLVTGGESTAALEPGALVDVLVTRDGADGDGRTRAEHTALELLAIAPAPDGLGPEDGAPPPGRLAATLAVDRRTAIALVEAEAFARDIRLLPADGRE